MQLSMSGKSQLLQEIVVIKFLSTPVWVCLYITVGLTGNHRSRWDWNLEKGNRQSACRWGLLRAGLCPLIGQCRKHAIRGRKQGLEAAVKQSARLLWKIWPLKIMMVLIIQRPTPFETLADTVEGTKSGVHLASGWRWIDMDANWWTVENLGKILLIVGIAV